VISIKIDTSGFERDVRNFLQGVQKQKDYALAVALTETAKDVRLAEMAEMPKQIDRPSPFTLRGIGYTPATKASLTATVFIRDVQATYLAKLIKGGPEAPRRKAFFIPEGIKTDRYGNLPRNAMLKLRARKDVFSGTVNGIPGLWQRQGKGIKLLVRYDDQRTQKPTFDFYGIARKTIAQRWPINFAKAWERAQATAR
jgi:hypothetical protein